MDIFSHRLLKSSKYLLGVLNNNFPISEFYVPIHGQLARGRYPCAYHGYLRASLEGYRRCESNMGLVFRLFARPILALQDSEKAHMRALKLLRIICSNPFTRLPLKILFNPKKKLNTTLFGQDYSHPFGLAAGMDKKAEALIGWETIGLGFIEVGGITQHEQDGNPKPRMFRSSSSRSLVNRMGFNNPGSQKMASTLENHYKKHGKPSVPLWINLGKSKFTPLEESHIDYSTTFKLLWQYGDVFVINVSSPNTPNLRELQNDESLAKIINSCQEINQELANKNKSSTNLS